MAVSPEYLILNSRDELLRIDINSIMYFEADGNYTRIITANNLKAVVCMNLARMLALLNARLCTTVPTFARVGKKHIINLNHIYSIHTLKQQLVLSDGRSFAYTIPISKEALKELKHIIILSNTPA